MNQNQIMKIKNVIVAALSVVALVSCGEAEPTICSCTELSLEGFKEVGMDQEKMQAFEDTHKAELEKCEALGDKLNDEMQELSAEEQEAKREEFMADCPAMKELETLIMEQMQNAYQNFDMEEGLEEGMGDILEGVEGDMGEMLEGLEESGSDLLDEVKGELEALK